MSSSPLGLAPPPRVCHSSPPPAGGPLGLTLDLRRDEGYDHSYCYIATFIEEHLRHHATILNA